MSRHNIRKAIKTASPGQVNQGLIWYRDYSKLIIGIGEAFGASPRRTVGAFSALSPRITLNQNIIALTRLLKAWDASPSQDVEALVIPGFGMNKIKAWDILNNGAVNMFDKLGGMKTANFYYNLLEPYKVQGHGVTVDTWAFKAWAGDAKADYTSGIQGKRYDTIALHYRDVAQELDLLPCQAQAIAWLAYRDKYQIN